MSTGRRGRACAPWPIPGYGPRTDAQRRCCAPKVYCLRGRGIPARRAGACGWNSAPCGISGTCSGWSHDSDDGPDQRTCLCFGIGPRQLRPLRGPGQDRTRPQGSTASRRVGWPLIGRNDRAGRTGSGAVSMAPMGACGRRSGRSDPLFFVEWEGDPVARVCGAPGPRKRRL